MAAVRGAGAAADPTAHDRRVLPPRPGLDRRRPDLALRVAGPQAAPRNVPAPRHARRSRPRPRPGRSRRADRRAQSRRGACRRPPGAGDAATRHADRPALGHLPRSGQRPRAAPRSRPAAARRHGDRTGAGDRDRRRGNRRQRAVPRLHRRQQPASLRQVRTSCRHPAHPPRTRLCDLACAAGAVCHGPAPPGLVVGAECAGGPARAAGDAGHPQRAARQAPRADRRPPGDRYAALGGGGQRDASPVAGAADQLTTGGPRARDLRRTGVSLMEAESRALQAGPVECGLAAPAARGLPARPAQGSAVAAIRDYLALTKPRIIALLLVTTVATMLVADPAGPGVAVVLWTMLGGYLAAGGAGAINHYLDREVDARMARTRRRPLVSGRIVPRHGLLFGVALGTLAFVQLAITVNLLAAALAMVGLLGYVFVYTLWLKPLTPQNIVIGGAAGAVPPLVGWAAATGGLSLDSLYPFAIVFFWTPPHFWALSLLIKDDYARTGVPMLPVVRGEAGTRRQIAAYSLILLAASVAPVVGGLFGAIYLGAALLLGGTFCALAVRLRTHPARRAALRLYLYSLVYLALLFAAMAADRVV